MWRSRGSTDFFCCAPCVMHEHGSFYHLISCFGYCAAAADHPPTIILPRRMILRTRTTTTTTTRMPLPSAAIFRAVGAP